MAYLCERQGIDTDEHVYAVEGIRIEEVGQHWILESLVKMLEFIPKAVV